LSQLRDSTKTGPVIIDEAQKVPELFDEIKSIVDEDKRPGQFLLLGSTEFSRENKILESLTGRISRSRMFPLVLSETLQLKKQGDVTGTKNKITRVDFIRFLKNGGFPAIFAIRNENEREDRLNEWVKLTCERDVLQVKRLRPDPDLCMRIFESLSLIENPDVVSIARRVNQSVRRVQTQLNALEQIFAIHSLRPHPLSPGKTLYFHIDPSIVNFFKGDFQAQLDSAFLTEYMAKISYNNLPRHNLSYFRGARGSRLSLLVERSPNDILAIKWINRETFDKRDLSILDACQKKLVTQKIKTKKIFVCGISEALNEGDVAVLPWEYLC